MGDSGAEESDDGWLDDCSSDDEPPVARGRSPDARNGAPSVLAGSSAGDEGTDSRGFIESPDARETPKEATDGWGVEDVELPRAGADDAHRDPPVHAAEADARVGFPEGNAGRKSLETKTTDRETDAPYLDFSVKSPWERFARAVETTARAWLRLTDFELRDSSTVNDSRPDHGSRDLRCLRAVVEHDNAHFRRDPYAVLLYFKDDAERPNVLAFGRNDARETPDEDAFPSDARNDARAKHLRRSVISQRAICAPENDLAPGSVGVQRWFGAGLSAPFAVVEPLRANAVNSSVASVSRTFADVDEATAAKAAVAVAFAAAGVPSHWPVFAPVLGPARRAFVGRTGDDDANTFGGWSVRYETDSLEGVAAERAAARTVFGLCDVLRAQLAALHGALVAETLAAEAKVTARLAFPLLRNRRRRRRRKRNAAVGRGRSAATTRIDDESGSSSSSASSSSGGSSSESEDEDVRAGEAFLAVAGGGAPPRLKKKRTPEGADESVGATRKKNAESRGGDVRREMRFKNANLRWDDDAPWAPWAALPDPWRRVEVHATYRQVPLAELKELKGGLSLEAAPLWTVRAVPRGAAESTESGVFSAGAFFGDQSGPGGAGPDTVDDGSCSDDARGVTGARGARGPGGDAGGPERGLAELYYLLSRSVLTRAARDADTMGRLASAEFWDDEAATGVSPPPRAPPESVVQDVLRDIFSAEGEGGHGRVLANERAFEGDASSASFSAEKMFSRERNSLFPNPARSAPPDSLLARVALHALVFGNARAVATLWRRFVREIRFAHWDRGVALPRTGGVGFEAGRRRRFFGAREERAPEDHRTHAAEEEEDPEETAFRDECVDVRACLVHQKIQLIDACIRRRKQKAVDEYERSDAARERRDRDARDVSGGWDDVGGGWDDDVDFVTPSTTVSVDGVSRAISEKRRTNVNEHEMSTKSRIVDDDIDLVALLGAAEPAAAETSRKTPPDSQFVADRDDDGFETASDGGDDEGLAVDEDVNETSGGPSRVSEGAKKTHPDGLRLLNKPHRLIQIPKTQPPPLFTEDTAREREAAMHALGDTPEGRAVRVRLQSDQLVSDMSAFKAANPGSCLADFVRWHSPRDWIEEETEAEETRDGDTDAKIAPRPGKLSARMGSANNTWKTLWRDAPIVPASRQKPLFDPIREGERALEYLDTAPPPEIFAQILAAAAAAVGDAYAETFFVSSSGEEHLNDEFKAPDAPSREALTRAHAMATRVLSRACPYEAEYAAVAGELQRAERAVARSLALKKRMPGVSNELRETLLIMAAEDEARADAEHAEVTEERSSVNANAEHDPHTPETPETPPPRPPPRAVETALQRTHPERRGGSALAALLPREKEKKNARGSRGTEPGADASESAAFAEYVVRVGGGHAQTHRAHAVVAPCFLRVSSAVAYQY